MNMMMKKLPIAALVLGAGVMALSAPAIAGIKNTKHNLGSGGTGANHLTNTTNEICVFCHTPHGSDTTAAVPLWNRALEDTPGATYTTYDDLGTTTLDGIVAQVGSVSIACLSCHDGQQAMDMVLNAPGSGNTGTTAAPFDMSGTWAGNDKPQGIANLGVDLKNDHPVGIQYGGGGITSATLAGTLKDPDFVAPKNTDIDGKKIWWVDTSVGTADQREKTDMQLYSRQVVSANGDVAGGNLSLEHEPFVECASCHDPHSENTTFLRILNSNSDVCLACHTK